ncbi:hypothetical protein [Rhodococcus sp. 3A]|uniref:hypothetical protein n=1 Tax=Rhodococcus sp. 3A TaxID=2834581 RepID=UPI00207860C7|nr:hypothetical protein [Rhodococcus sp. 3A]
MPSPDLNRQIATGLWMITHSMADLETAADGATTSRAVGFLERARVKIIGPIPEKEIDRLDGVGHLHRHRSRHGHQVVVPAADDR